MVAQSSTLTWLYDARCCPVCVHDPLITVLVFCSRHFPSPFSFTFRALVWQQTRYYQQLTDSLITPWAISSTSHHMRMWGGKNYVLKGRSAHSQSFLFAMWVACKEWKAEWSTHPNIGSVTTIWPPVYRSLILRLFLLHLNPIGSLIHFLPNKTVFFSIGLLTSCNMKIYLSALFPPEGSQLQSSFFNHPTLNGSRSPGVVEGLAHPATSFKLICCRPKLPALLTYHRIHQ